MNSRMLWIIFGLAFLGRLIWLFVSGLDYTDGADYSRYQILSDQLLAGQFNPSINAFIVSPLFPVFQAFFKYLNPFGHWVVSLQLAQITLSSLSAVYLTKASYFIFSRKSVAIFSGLLYSFCFPFFYWTHLASQESLFQSLFIISFYHIVKYIKSKSLNSIFYFALFYTLALLTKSHIILILPGFLLIIFLAQPRLSRKILHSSVLIGLIFFINLPYGLFTFSKYNTFVLSSKGGPFYFLTGHNDDYYQFLVNTPSIDSPEFLRLQSMDFKDTKIDNIELRTPSERQKIYLERGLSWTLANINRLPQLTLANAINHLRPGYAFRFRKINIKLLIVNFIYLFIYFAAYTQIIKSIPNWRWHMPMFIVTFGMFLFAITFYSQNRFRNITVDPIYLIYASPILLDFLSSLRKRSFLKKIFKSI